jgi:protocatechuate 3,4-dioxygenase beta subunit
MMTPDGKGAYHVETVMPGHYPDRVAQHVHYMVKAPGCKPLITQLYFGTDPVFEGDPDRKVHGGSARREPRARAPGAAHRRSGIAHRQSHFELCLERA